MAFALGVGDVRNTAHGPGIGSEPTTLRLTAAAPCHVSIAMVTYPVEISGVWILRKSCGVMPFSIASGTKTVTVVGANLSAETILDWQTFTPGSSRPGQLFWLDLNA